MTTRFSYPMYWAEGGVATDPDLDTTDPSYVADKYEKVGWISQKPPEHWQNFLTQISDVKIIELLSHGLQVYDSSVSYAAGAIIRVSEDSADLAMNVSGAPNNKAPTSANGWEVVLDPTGSGFSALLEAIRKQINDHLAADNPHKDTIGGLVGGGYTKAQVDKAFGDPTSPTTIVFHKARTGRVHSETPAQVGTLPTTGGRFTGPVGFLSKLAFNAGKTIFFRLDQPTARVEMSIGDFGLAIDSVGNAFGRDASGVYLVLTQANYDAVNIRTGFTFALPMPLFAMNLEESICDGQAVGDWYLDTSKDPEFTLNMGLKISNNTLTVYSAPVGTAATLYVVGNKADGTLIANVVDIAAKTYATVNAMVAEVSADITFVKQVVAYPQLNLYQKSMLVIS